MKKLRRFKLYLSPFFVSKYYLLKNIKSILSKYDFEGSVLDFGCGEMPYKYVFPANVQYKGIDIKDYSKNKDFNREEPDFYFDDNYLNELTLPFKRSSFNNVVSFQVLEHHINPDIMISELARITKKNGFLLMTAPFMGGVHEEPRDYQRFTEFGLKELLSKHGWKVLEIKRQGSIFSTLSNLLNEYLNNYAAKSKTKYLVSIIIYLPFIMFAYLSMLLDLIFRSKKVVLGYAVIAQKSTLSEDK